jgi:hypothetical protein
MHPRIADSKGPLFSCQVEFHVERRLKTSNHSTQKVSPWQAGCWPSAISKEAGGPVFLTSQRDLQRDRRHLIECAASALTTRGSLPFRTPADTSTASTVWSRGQRLVVLKSLFLTPSLERD